MSDVTGRAGSAPTIEAILPVRDMTAHVEKCVELLASQLRRGDRITLVDDGSHTAVALEHPAVRLLRFETSQGPYTARNSGAETSDRDALLFVDARSRPYPGLIDSHRELLSQAGNAMSCTNVEVIAGRSLASRIAATQDLFRLGAYVGRPGALDYYPTANLGVLRSAFLGVGGFPEVRSGSDARLCWNVQLAGYGRLGVDERVLMGWVPRDSVPALIRQMYRYGLAAAELQTTHDTVPDRARWSDTARRLARQCTTPTRAGLAFAAGGTYLAHAVGQYQGRRRLTRSVGPHAAPQHG